MDSVLAEPYLAERLIMVQTETIPSPQGSISVQTKQSLGRGICLFSRAVIWRIIKKKKLIFALSDRRTLLSMFISLWLGSAELSVGDIFMIVFDGDSRVS